MNIKNIRSIDSGSTSGCGCSPPGNKGQTKPSCCAPAPRQTAVKTPCCRPATQPSPQTSSNCAASDQKADAKPPCCGPAATVTGGEIDENVPGFLGWLTTATGRVPQIRSELSFIDHLGACKARWALNRMNFIVPPGLYAIGSPSGDDPVVVTSNYKMTYDIVRQALAGHNIWLLVLETFGINVWCAAGKGTFGTDELVRRINDSGLAKVVNHRRLLLPILGAPGVAAHEVARETGFTITYATIRADDLPQFLDNGMITTREMRQLTFSFYERLILVPVELVTSLRTALLTTLALFIIGLIAGGTAAGIKFGAAYLGAMLTGVAVGPMLLPWLPGKSFAVKGAAAGILWSLAWYMIAGGSSWNIAETVAVFLGLPAISAFYTLNFTGCSTYTSRTGVKKEMRLSLPAMGGALVLSLLLLLIGRFQ
ncbi:acetyl-CoA decarbonylase/synthase complex subunit gamma [Geobacter sp. OR-1]|uniref:mercury methylation corrinoid protein HgcA n=1 Tax=Geobacter sp. OR-1 TaxID=1266765 RepID=UPI0005432BD6|nr:mercury methylation corrinoid protein HgcA [Geobacter sp. OR-1]GAM10307.1 acetyl-CoA decarbonylase/synthase complex subunit gamma [Geobacter sp. OR-1]